ncbi:vesicle transport through interaction with t-snares [Emiliania huxleyi CCMP1516]|uniref:Vesicle transport v-SNARE N-terminal domain-containing protein n=2 Tax=Emiliania huxleyi TaxID=2903 RepID=A0A0D3JCK4_EMIH1|nr:vesicle transport through interaction with t-snares [Emiliania huxleyi CCMP1516]EOD21239.1 vesicle transport through interaction with t-snares [Emiliania huxleyi CCMP1516]|eukprot:XP_005773668.1 vesicle transport through interaction with t-snares [Emiliania huxleyi CCMP1516]
MGGWRARDFQYQAQLDAVYAKTRALDDEFGPARRAAITRCEADLAAAREALGAVELEVNALPRSERAAGLEELKAHKAKIAALAADLKRAVVSLPRDELLGRDDPEEAATLRGEREEAHARLLATHDRTRAGTRKLRDAARTVAETEEIGAAIMGDLAAQRQTLMHSSGVLRATAERLDRSRKLVAAIGRRAWQSRMIMRVMIAMLAVLVLLLLYFMMAT